MAPSPFAGEAARSMPVPASTGCARVGPCFGQSGIWIGVTVLLLVILMAISIVPLFGQIAAHLLVPLFGAGMFRVCRRMSNNEEPEISDLFAGFHHQAGQLVMVGVFSPPASSALPSRLPAGQRRRARRWSPARWLGFGIAFGGVMLAGLLVLVLSIPVIMALVRPALVYFHDMKPLDAMKASFAAGPRTGWRCASSAFSWWSRCSSPCCRWRWGCCSCRCFPARFYASYRDIFMGS